MSNKISVVILPLRGTVFSMCIQLFRYAFCQIAMFLNNNGQLQACHCASEVLNTCSEEDIVQL